MTEVESSHVPMLSKPDVVIDVIRKAAKAIHKTHQPSEVARLLIFDRLSQGGLSPFINSPVTQVRT